MDSHAPNITALFATAPRRARVDGDALAVAAFHSSPRPHYIVDGERRLIEMNSSAEALHAAAFVTDPGGRLTVGRPAVDAVLSRRIQVVLDGLGPAGAALKLADGRLRGLLFHDLGDGDHVLMSVNLPFEERRCDVGVLAEAYGLTPAELRLLALLLTGMAAKTAAGRVNASLHTVRTQIRSILLKSESANLQILLAKSAQLL